MSSWNYQIDAGRRARPITLAEAGRRVPRGALVWVHLDGRDPAHAAWLAQCEAIPMAVRSALTAVETRPRTEPVGYGALINLRGLGDTPEDDPDALVSVRLWAERGRVISVSYRTLGAMDALRAAAEAGKLRDPGDLISVLATLITGTLDPVIAGLGDEIDLCEESELNARNAIATRRRIARVRSEAIAYRRFVSPQRQALDALATLDASWLEDDDRLHLREAADRFARMTEELEAVRDRAALLHEQLTDLRAEQTETRTLILSIVALVFLPLTFLTGLLGMNVAGIPYAQEPWAFWAVVALCSMVAAGIAVYFARADWFRG